MTAVEFSIFLMLQSYAWMQ